MARLVVYRNHIYYKATMRFPARPPEFELEKLDVDTIRRVFPHVSPSLPDGRYLHWDQLRRRPPPEGLSHQEWWFAQKFARRSTRVLVPHFVDDQGKPFSFSRLDAIDRATHELDRQGAARAMIEALGDEGARTQYRIDQLIEEAISSSLIEGAKLTTRACGIRKLWRVEIRKLWRVAHPLRMGVSGRRWVVPETPPRDRHYDPQQDPSPVSSWRSSK